MPDHYFPTPQSFRHWHTVTSHIAAALCEAGYPCKEEHVHGLRIEEGGKCTILFDGSIPPLEVIEKAFTLCNAKELWESLRWALEEGGAG